MVRGCFVEHWRDVQTGPLCADAASGTGGGRSKREVAREFGPSGEPCENAAPFRAAGRRLRLIDAVLEEDKSRPFKQRHTAKRTFGLLRTEYDFTGGYTLVDNQESSLT